MKGAVISWDVLGVRHAQSGASVLVSSSGVKKLKTRYLPVNEAEPTS